MENKVNIGDIIYDKGGWRYLIVNDSRAIRLLCLNNNTLQVSIFNTLDELYTFMHRLGFTKTINHTEIIKIIKGDFKDNENYVKQTSSSSKVYINGGLLGWIYPDNYFEANELHPNTAIIEEFKVACYNMGLKEEK